jgi:hypothetical protein
MYVERFDSSAPYETPFPTSVVLTLGLVAKTAQVVLEKISYSAAEPDDYFSQWYDPNPTPGVLNHEFVCRWVDAGLMHE